MSSDDSVAVTNLAFKHIYNSIPTSYNKISDDVTIVRINCSDKEDTTATAWLTDDSSVESDEPPILRTTMPMAPRHKSWQTTLDTLDIKTSSNADTILNTSNIKIAMDMAIVDAGATGHFVLPGTPVTNL